MCPVIRTMLGAGAMTTLGALPVYLLSAQAVLVREDLSFSEPQLGLAVSAFFAAGALVSVSAGVLVDRLGRRASTVVAGCLSGLSAGGIALAASSFATLLSLLILAGVANAALQVTANAAIARVVPSGRQGLAYALKQCAVPVSILLGGVAVPTVAVVFGWRWPFAAAAFGALLVALLGLRLNSGLLIGPHHARTGERPPTGALVVTAAGMTLASAACTSLGTFFPIWAFETGVTPGAAGLLLASVSALSIAARIGAGLAADRRRGHHLSAVAIHLVLGAVGFLLLAVGNVVALLVGAVLAFAVGWSWPGLLLYAVVQVGRDRPATSSSAVQVGAFTGGAVGPVLFGVLVSTTGYRFAWRAGALVLITAAALMLLARRMFLDDLNRRPPQAVNMAPPLHT